MFGWHACRAMQADSLLCEDLPVARRRLRVSLVTETFPPEINGVAMTLGRLVAGLQARDHPVQLIRPRQGREAEPGDDTGVEQVLRPGIPIPRYAGLNMGLPAKGMLSKLWAARRPDIVHIATEGPLGWSALAAAEKLRLPVVSGFHTNFDRYSRHYGIGWLKKPIHAYLRKFHNRAGLTLVPTRSLREELTVAGFRNVEVLARGVDPMLFDPARRSTGLRQAWGLEGDALAAAGSLAFETERPAARSAFLDRVVRGKAEERGIRLRAVDVGHAVGSLAEAGIGLFRHDRHLQFGRIPALANRLDGILVADRAGGQR